MARATPVLVVRCWTCGGSHLVEGRNPTAAGDPRQFQPDCLLACPHCPTVAARDGNYEPVRFAVVTTDFVEPLDDLDDYALSDCVTSDAMDTYYDAVIRGRPYRALTGRYGVTASALRTRVQSVRDAIDT